MANTSYPMTIQSKSGNVFIKLYNKLTFLAFRAAKAMMEIHVLKEIAHVAKVP